jgi:hypothetical protein
MKIDNVFSVTKNVFVVYIFYATLICVALCTRYARIQTLDVSQEAKGKSRDSVCSYIREHVTMALYCINSCCYVFNAGKPPAGKDFHGPVNSEIRAQLQYSG